VALSGDRVVVAGDHGLTLIDIADPSSPQLLGSMSTPGVARGVALSGSHAYVAGQDGLLVVDVADPGAPWIAGRIETLGDTEDVAVPGLVALVAYVADGHSGLQVIDVRDPAAPRRLGGADTPDAALGVSVAGDHVHIVDYTAGLMILPAQCEHSAAVEDAAWGAVPMRLSVWPNPSPSGASIEFPAAAGDRPRIGVYDPAGRRIRDLSADLSADCSCAGFHRLAWDGRDDSGRAAPAGGYLIRVRTGRATATSRLVMMR